MGRFALAVLLLAVTLSPGLWGQRRPPVLRPPEIPAAGGGLPTPPWLGRGRTITGHIMGIDPDRILVRSFEYGNVLFFVDQKTVVRVDKHRLSLADLREGDPVAVRLKEIKGKGPYATEILPHPEVRRRKEQGTQPEREVTPDPLPESQTEPIRSPQSAIQNEEAPALPAGQKGVTGSVTEVQNEEITVRDREGKIHKVLVTSVTRIVRSGTDQVLGGVRTGDRVAVVGDTLNTGLLVAREVLVNRSAEAEASGPAAGGGETGQFAGAIVAIEADTIHVRTPDGRQRVVLVTGVTTISRWGAEVPFSALRKGDQVSVTGDVLEGGSVVAREVSVIRPAR